MVNQHKATTSTPHIVSVGGDESQNKNILDDVASRQADFVSIAVEMSWQLALAVLLPLIGGHLLDDHYHTTPWLTFAGLALAFAGGIAVMGRAVAEANRRNTTKPKDVA